MPVPSSVTDLSTTPASNFPAGSESPSTIDDYLRAHAAIIRQVSDAKANTSHNHAGVYEPADATILKDADIGVTVQAYDAATAKTNTAQNFTAPQRSALLTDNDGSFDLSAKQNFKCTPAGAITLTFTGQASGVSGAVILVNSGGHTISAHANTKLAATDLTRLSVAGTYRIDYLSDGTNAYCSVTGAFA